LSEKKPFLPTERLKFFNSIALHFQRLSICLKTIIRPSIHVLKKWFHSQKQKNEVDSRKEKKHVEEMSPKHEKRDQTREK
jgi:hypothetical protein